MSKTLVYQTNKEFDKCAELLRSIVNAQKSRRDSSSPIVHKDSRKEKQNSSTNRQLKKQSSKITITKTSFIKTNKHNGTNKHERRSFYSPQRPSHSTVEDSGLSKNRLSPNKSRKQPSPCQTTRQHLISSLPTNKISAKSCSRSSIKDEFIRSSSCSDLGSLKSNLMQKEQTRSVLEHFLTSLSRIRIISKQIRSHHNDKESLFLWNELENCLSVAMSYAKNDIQFQLSLVPLRSEILELRRQLQTTNSHLYKYNLIRRSDDRYVDLQKKFDTNQTQCRQLSLHNEQLKSKCQNLQDKFDHLQRNHVQLIQRITQQNIRSVAQRTEWISTDNHFLLREEIIFLKEKLYHVYDDLATVFNQNHQLESNIKQQKKQLSHYEQQFKNLKQSAQCLLHDVNNRSVEDKTRQFLSNILHDQHEAKISPSTVHQIHVTPLKPVNSSPLYFTSPQKPNVIFTSSQQPIAAHRTHVSPTKTTNRFRPKSLFVTPTILNDSNVLSKFRDHRDPTVDITQYSSSTIDDADSTLTSSSSSISLCYPQRKRKNLYNSLPTLTQSSSINCPKTAKYRENYNNESDPELDEISNLTSKLFSSEDHVDIPIRDVNISTSSSSTPSTRLSDAERRILI
ncbi:unnamed protein product [Adineta ricciae]|uniref:Uncharacterized protein n=1 Tax=Adineta ricciae TaxID=249248 RepID=A0A814GKF1_ADIRI|nr:unnamed protein product [Adineta ricciae]